MPSHFPIASSLLRILALGTASLLWTGSIACSDSTSPRNAVTALAQSGSGQTGQVGTLLAAPLVILVQRGSSPLAGAIVHFSVAAGGGTLSAVADTTGADGTAHVMWTMGDTAGHTPRVNAYLIQGNDSVSAGMFTASAIPGPVSQIVVVSGTLQRGLPNTAFHDSLVAEVTDQYGNGLEGRQVTWAVQNGGGTITPPTSTTDSLGRAVAHGVYGSSYGANVLVATTDSVTLPATFVSSASAGATNDITVAVTTVPDFPQTFVNVTVAITSTYQIASVVGTLENQIVPFTVSAGTAVAAFATSGLAAGVHAGTVTMVDVLGNSKTVPFTITRASPVPTITVASPQQNAIVGTSITAQATCTTTDPAGCVSITVSRHAQIVATGKQSVTATLSLGNYEDTWVPIIFTATPMHGSPVAETTYVLPNTNTHRSQVARTDGATVLDYDGSRLLYRTALVGPMSNDTTKLLDAGGTTRVLATGGEFGSFTIAAGLTSTGAVLQRGVLNGTVNVLRYAGGMTTTLGTQHAQYVFVPDGDYLAWSTSTFYDPHGASASVYQFANVVTGNTVTIDSLPPSGPSATFDVFNGTVTTLFGLFSDVQALGQINGVLTVNDAEIRSFNPKTDGVRVVYVQRTQSSNEVTYTLRLYGDGQDVVLESMSGPLSLVNPFQEYAINNGWVLYSVGNVGSTSQMWIRSPTGVKTLANPLTGFTTIAALGADGRAVVVNSSKLYLLAPPFGVPVSLGNALGKVVWRGGHFYEFLRGSVALLE